MILRHRARPFLDVREEWRLFDSEKLAQIPAHPSDDFTFIEREDFRLQSAADESPKKRVTLGRAPRKLHAAESAGQRGAPFDDWRNEAEAVERVRDVCALVSKIDRCGRSVRNRVELICKLRFRRAQQFRRIVSGKRKTNRIRIDRLARARVNLPSTRFLVKRERLSFCVETNRDIF